MKTLIWAACGAALLVGTIAAMVGLWQSDHRADPRDGFVPGAGSDAEADSDPAPASPSVSASDSVSASPSARAPASRSASDSAAASAASAAKGVPVRAEGWIAVREGRPIAGALVIPLGEGTEIGGLDEAIEATEGEDGVVRLRFDGAGEITLRREPLADDSGLDGVRRPPFELRGEGRARMRLDLVPGGDADGGAVAVAPPPVTTVVSGTVIDPEGSGVAGATVSLRSRALAAGHVASTGSGGGFLFEDVVPGEDHVLEVVARHGFRRLVRDALLVPPDGLFLELPLERSETATVAGRMIAPGGEPLGGIGLLARPAAGGPATQVVGDGEGRFRAELPEGDLIFETRVAPRLTVRGVRLEPGAEVELTLVLDVGPHELEGVVVGDKGEPVTGVRLVLAWSHVDGELRSASSRVGTTDRSGRFVFSGLAGGPHALRVTAEGYRGRELPCDVGPATADLRVELEKVGEP